MCLVYNNPEMAGKTNKEIENRVDVSAGFVIAVLCFAVVNDIAQRVTTSEFCGTTCHEMDGVYRGWKASEHYANRTGSLTHCVDCHLPPQAEYFARSANELYEGTKDIFRHFSITEVVPDYNAVADKNGDSRIYEPNVMRQKVLASKMPDTRCTRCPLNAFSQAAYGRLRIAHENPNKLKCVECHKVMHERIDK